jgi:nucleobindin
VYNKKKSKDEEEHQRKADHIVNTVLSAVDQNKDGKISKAEFEQAGLDSLPNFEELGAEGHHYDVESGE